MDMDAQHEDPGQDGDSLRAVRDHGHVVCPFLSALASVAKGSGLRGGADSRGKHNGWTRRAVHYSARSRTLTAGCGTVQR